MRAYASVLMGHAGVTVLCLHWRSLWEERVPWLVFVLAILMASVFGGAGPALLATALSTLAVVYFFLEPFDAFAIAHPADQAHVIALIMAGVALSASAGHIQRARERLLAQGARALRDSEARFRRLWESNLIGVVYTRDDGAIIDANDAFLRLVGYTHDDLLAGRLRTTDLTPPDLRERDDRGMAEARERGACAPYEKAYITRDGQRVPVLIGYALVDGSSRDFVSFVLDLTEKRRAEAAVAREFLLESERAARAEAERESRLKDEFVATLSHELRTPLNAVLGWTDLARRPGLAPDQLDRALSIVERNGRLLAQIIADLLDVSRAINGKLHLDLAPIDVSGAVEGALEALRSTAEAKGITVEARLDRRAPPVVGDAERVKQIAINLISNAIKFTPRGGRVEVTVELRGAMVEIAVGDTGEGIEPAFLPHVFERFRQAEASASRRHGGLGLGLAIVKHLAEAHGGRVHAESAGRGQGARFTVELPAAPEVAAVEPRSRGRRRTDALAGAHILVVDDEADAQEMVKRFLEDEGASIVTAGSADEALAVLADVHVDALVSDIGMPGMDGCEMMRRVRARAQKVPAIALTAYARPEDRERALEAGFAAHLCKPVDLGAMAAALAAVLKPAAE